jgi:uncharacterized membrane protein
MSDPESPSEVGTHNAERLKFFTDAVVAIAMTLLILPLLDLVQEASREGTGTGTFLHDSREQLFSFALSFAIIASFWVSHERLFDYVGHWSGRLMVLNIGWMFTIVSLPVATAMTGSMNTDRLQILVYVGTMLASTLLMAAMDLVVRRTPSTWRGEVGPGTGGLVSALALVILFTAALLLGVAAPDRIGFLAMLLLLLTRPLEILLNRLLWQRAATPPVA